MDKQFFRKQSFKESADHQQYYQTLSSKEQTEVFYTLMAAAYGFVGKEFPKMEKRFIEKRKFVDE
jgi:hypothetical protein